MGPSNRTAPSPCKKLFCSGHVSMMAAMKTAALLVLMAAASASALPYGNNNMRYGVGEWSPKEGVEAEAAADATNDLAPLAQQIDFWRLMLHSGVNEGLVDADEMRRIAQAELRRRLIQQNHGNAAQRPKRRGSCLFHAGLAHNCDYRDVVGAVDQASHWGSDMAPGKRRKKRSSAADEE